MASETYGEFLICPHCGYVHKDSWEIGEGGEEDGETDCAHCGKEFLYSRRVHVTYHGKPKPDVVM